jgi:hypothetical protein
MNTKWIETDKKWTEMDTKWIETDGKWTEMDCTVQTLNSSTPQKIAVLFLSITPPVD